MPRPSAELIASFKFSVYDSALRRYSLQASSVWRMINPWQFEMFVTVPDGTPNLNPGRRYSQMLWTACDQAASFLIPSSN